MSMIYDKCPKKNLPVSTGFEANLETFSSLPGVRTRYHCEASGDIHILLLEEARVTAKVEGRIESRYEPMIFK